jgi:mono/diheme cytochrome c family protein
VAASLLALLLAGCVQEMADQPRYGPLQATTAFPDGRSSRPPVPGTVARGQLRLDDAFYTGRTNGQLVAELPATALEGRTTAELLDRGRERYGIYCSHCHGLVGGGTGGSPEMEQAVGMVVKRGFPMPPTYHQDRLRQVPIGHFFDVITNGFGRMPAHDYLVSPEDRWAIATYIRALQVSQQVMQDQLSPQDLQELNEEPKNPPPGEETVL